MEKLIQKFDRVYIDQESWESPLARRFRQLFSADRIEMVVEKPRREAGSSLAKEEFDRSKRELFLTPYKGRFFKRCPGSHHKLACCNYFVLNWGQQCDFNCSYCYLQSFLNSPVTVLYTNLDQALDELRELAPGLKEQTLRVGTGEVVDSLSLDPLTQFSLPLIEFFRDYPRWTLEFKTKSNHIDELLKVPAAKNILVSWSINPQYIVGREENGTAPLPARLDAAEACLRHGYGIAFHIDPIIYHPEWRQNYGDLVDQITSRFNPEDMPYISLGALRYQPEQRHMIRQRFGSSSLALSYEMFQGLDGKLRYDQELRKEMFQWIIERFKSHSSAWKVFLCMETPETWLGAQQENPFKSKDLKTLFDTQVLRSVDRLQKVNNLG